MKSSLVLVVTCLMLTACQSAAEKAEDEYRIVAENAVDRADKCRAAGRVKDAWLAEGNAEKYELWTIVETGDCTEYIGG